MGLLGGPSKGVLLQMSQGIAGVAMQLKMVAELDEDTKNQVLEGMKAEGSPTSMDELIIMAASVIKEQSMGWYKKNQFLGMIFGSLVNVGMPPADANYIKGQIELLAN